MNATQRLTIRASEIRQRLNAISGLEGDALTEVIQAEEIKLQSEYRGVETKLRAAIASEPEPVATFSAESAEGRELRMLTARASVGAIFMAALDKGLPQGETRELQEHHGLGPNQIPLDMLRQPDRRPQEFAVTPAPGNVGQNQAPNRSRTSSRRRARRFSESTRRLSPWARPCSRCSAKNWTFGPRRRTPKPTRPPAASRPRY